MGSFCGSKGNEGISGTRWHMEKVNNARRRRDLFGGIVALSPSSIREHGHRFNAVHEFDTTIVHS